MISRDEEKHPKWSDKTLAEALGKSAIKELPIKATLLDMLSSAQKHKDALERFLALLLAEPVVLTSAVRTWFCSQPELLADDKGRPGQAINAHERMNGSVLEVVHSHAQAVAIWHYICRLLERLAGLVMNEPHPAVLLQELSNVCQLEYERAQLHFKRMLQANSGLAFFYRLPDNYDKYGRPRVALKKQVFDAASPSFQSLLRLCQSGTGPLQAVEIFDSLTEANKMLPMMQKAMAPWELNALEDLVGVVVFNRELATAVTMPPVSRRKGQTFGSRVQKLEVDLVQLKPEVDLLSPAIPIEHLLEPDRTLEALERVSRFISDKMRASFESLYKDLVQDCLADVETRHQRQQDKVRKRAAAAGAEWIPFPSAPIEPAEKPVEQKREKEKTRPAHSSVNDPIAPASPPAPSPKLTVQQPTFKVSASTAAVFAALFDPSQARGSIDWAAFMAAMVELGFTAEPAPGGGSGYTFSPPESMGVTRAFGAHRPHGSHGSRVEGAMLAKFARRLKKKYGWDQDSFEVA